MDENKGIARVKFHPGKLEEWKRLRVFTPWMALQDQELVEEDNRRR